MQAGDYVIYQNGDRFELGLIKRMRPDGELTDCPMTLRDARRCFRLDED